MIEAKKAGKRILVVHGLGDEYNSDELALGKLVEQLELEEIEVLFANNEFDAAMVTTADPMISAVLLDWELDGTKQHKAALQTLKCIREHSKKVPIFLFAKRADIAEIPVEVLKETSDFIWLYEDTASFIAGRIKAAIKKYSEEILPPMFKALTKFSDVHEYSWHTPGHTGGTAFMKSPSGRAFFEFFGESMFRSDLSISVGDLGSLLDHSGPIGAGEKYAAKVFGADRTYTVTNGSSTSNRVIFMACVTRNQIALCDRNCHKSIEQALTLTGAIPHYMMPLRNFYGIIGPIPPAAMQASNLQKALKTNKLVTKDVDPKPVHAIVTNSTYDGLCYNVKRVEELLGKTVDRMHFDEAWYGYARFNPMYQERCAMHGDVKEHNKKTDMTIFATQSTHKLLAALSQASFIHVREGKNNVNHARFNESFMMHASTSPFYPIIASNDVTAAMMDHNGKRLTDECIHEAVAFRKLMSKLHADYANKGDWFFNCWQPEAVKNAAGKNVPFYQASSAYLSTQPQCWVLHPNESWHGFGKIEDNYCMLDPIKVSVTTPGITPSGLEKAGGIPASVLSSYLCAHGVVPEKTTDFTVLFLFSMGITKGKWGTLLDTLLKFKEDYDANTALEECLPDLVQANAERYNAMGLKDLCEEMFQAMKALKTTQCMAEGFATLPQPDVTPAKAYELLVKNEIESVTLDKAAQRTLATGIVPYPPGIPLLMPGENAGASTGPALSYLKALEAFDQKFPGFAHDSHGVEVEDGKYKIMVLKK